MPPSLVQTSATDGAGSSVLPQTPEASAGSVKSFVPLTTTCPPDVIVKLE